MTTQIRAELAFRDVRARYPQRAKIDALVLDVSLSETHLVENDVTDFPVESGANVTDHVRARPARLTLEGIVTDTPVTAKDRESASRREADGDTPRSIDAYNWLLSLRDLGDSFTVVTTLRTYENMVIESLSVPRAADSGGMVRFTAVMREIRIVSTQKVIEAVIAKPPVKTLGVLKPAPTPVAEQGATVLHDGIPYLFDFSWSRP